MRRSRRKRGKPVIVHISRAQHCQVVGSGFLRFLGVAVHINRGRVHRAQGPGLGIHKDGIKGDIPGNGIGHGNGSIVGGKKHHRVDQIFIADHIPLCQADQLAVINGLRQGTDGHFIAKCNIRFCGKKV